MAQTIEIHDKDDFILAVYSGEFDSQSAKETIDRILQACSEKHCSAALLDCRNMTGQITTFDRYDAATYGQVIKGIVTRMAVVGPPAFVLPDSFFENVARNRGLNLRVFIEMDKAVGWLMGQSWYSRSCQSTQRVQAATVSGDLLTSSSQARCM